MKKYLKLDKTFLIAAIPFLTYSVNYAFEYAYLRTYNVSPQFINISLNTLLSTCLYLLVFSFFSYFLISYLYMIYPHEFLISVHFFKKMHKNTLLIFSFLLFFLTLSAGFLGSMFVFLSLLLVTFVIPIFTFIKIKGYKNKLITQIKENNNPHTARFSQIIINNIGMTNYLLISAYLLIVSGALLMGQGQAVNKSTYLVSLKKPYIAVIRIYNDKAITETYNPKTKIINQEIKVYNTSDLPFLELKSLKLMRNFYQ